MYRHSDSATTHQHVLEVEAVKQVSKPAPAAQKPAAPAVPPAKPRLVYHCEGYAEMHPEAEPLLVPGMVKDETPVEPAIGLCLNCEHRDTCTLPRLEGGVWHCEEYA